MKNITINSVKFILDENQHVDDWLDESANYNLSDVERENLAYAKFVINWFRMPADKILEYKPWMQQHELYCTYKNHRYKVTCASRMGCIMLSSDFSVKAPGQYELSAMVNNCADWSSVP